MYANSLNTMFLTSFYSIIIPSCILWGIFSIFLQYNVDKYLFLRKRNSKFYLGRELGTEIIEQLEYVLPLYALSNIIFYYILLERFDFMPIFGVIISILHTFLPM